MLIMLGILNTILTLPAVIYEIAIGYSCQSSYALAVTISMVAKLTGESISFVLGYTFSSQLKVVLRRFKVFRAIERASMETPIMFAFMIRSNGYTGALITNYGQGVLRTV
jgi:membrane protein DedA with SNARE-associated domain